MIRLEALKALAEKVEAGDGEWNRIASALQFGAGFSVTDAQNAATAYTGSLDAAKVLHDAVLPGWGYAFDSSVAAAFVLETPNADGGVFANGVAENPARAWLLAILRALIAQETTP